MRKSHKQKIEDRRGRRWFAKGGIFYSMDVKPVKIPPGGIVVWGQKPCGSNKVPTT